ncbi:beta-ketoacyl synthase chain length factor [Aeromonas encheleia]|uniref:Beta-ketoacyl synthase chain length factor n=1 Tax=Aeromonas encheleia TaxID=73010 RepID=A0AAE9SFS7_9GAMM|nr:beta-ketoacyl synthase chain length factor [Aeromonas encheleia]USV58419.1 beta-ketoacyl synthase chain length factor [Aeromonas encheleia]
MLSFSLLDAQALSPGLDQTGQWRQWAEQGRWPADASMPLTPLLPMMMARRLSAGARLAVQLGLEMLARHPVDSVIFVSRHGELARSMTLLQGLAAGKPLSPTDFSMSVHNTAAGICSIQGKAALPMSSLAAGEGSLMAGLTEAVATLSVNNGRVLLVAFEGEIPAFHRRWLPATPPYAVALVLADEPDGESWRCDSRRAETRPPALAQPLAFWRAHLLQQVGCLLGDGRQEWSWRRD